jgi:MinD-like ATPase involved in chromosome partitioning or flagellar assembly
VLALAMTRPPLALDAGCRSWGGLAHRVRRRHAASVWDAHVHLDRMGDRAWVDRIVEHGPTGLHALVCEEHADSGRRPVTFQELVPVIGQLRAMYPLMLLDLRTADTSWTWQALSWGEAPLLVARASPDSVLHTMRLQSQLRAIGFTDVTERMVLVVVATKRHVEAEVRAAERQAATVFSAVIRVPYDPGLARAAPIDPRRLRRRTKTALLKVAEAIVGRCPADPQAAATLVDPGERWRSTFSGEGVA